MVRKVSGRLKSYGFIDTLKCWFLHDGLVMNTCLKAKIQGETRRVLEIILSSGNHGYLEGNICSHHRFAQKQFHRLQDIAAYQIAP